MPSGPAAIENNPGPPVDALAEVVGTANGVMNLVDSHTGVDVVIATFTAAGSTEGQIRDGLMAALIPAYVDAIVDADEFSIAYTTSAVSDQAGKVTIETSSDIQDSTANSIVLTSAISGSFFYFRVGEAFTINKVTQCFSPIYLRHEHIAYLTRYITAHLAHEHRALTQCLLYLFGDFFLGLVRHILSFVPIMSV